MKKNADRRKKIRARRVRDIIDEVAFIGRRIELFNEACTLLAEKCGLTEAGVDSLSPLDTVLDDLSRASENEELRLEALLAEEVPRAGANHEPRPSLVH